MNLFLYCKSLITTGLKIKHYEHTDILHQIENSDINIGTTLATEKYIAMKIQYKGTSRSSVQSFRWKECVCARAHY